MPFHELGPSGILKRLNSVNRSRMHSSTLIGYMWCPLNVGHRAIATLPLDSLLLIAPGASFERSGWDLPCPRSRGFQVYIRNLARSVLGKSRQHCQRQLKFGSPADYYTGGDNTTVSLEPQLADCLE